jgi:hypothetical protein
MMDLTAQYMKGGKNLIVHLLVENNPDLKKVAD